MKILAVVLICIASSTAFLDTVTNGFNKLVGAVKNEVNGAIDMYGSLSRALYPGTNYCGRGNIAKRFDDLGEIKDVDICCRAHDYCFQSILGHEVKYNLTNPEFYTSMNCECDINFKTCLKEINDEHSFAVGNIYFNMLGKSKKCFKKDYPVTGCISHFKSLFLDRCLEYAFDTTKEKVYQWFDIPMFE